MNFLIILICKAISYISRLTNLGNGSTWPGHVALMLNKNFVKDFLQNSKTKTILIAGTNGKTTTSKLIRTILKNNGNSFLHNKSGANLLNGVASSIIFSTNLFAKLDKDYAIFEIDENALPKTLEQITPNYIICLNLFRDQLDRYGEIDSIAKKWQRSFEKLDSKTTLILNADDPLISYLSKDTKAKSLYFGLSEKSENKLEHGADSLYCPNCNEKLDFTTVFFSHLGIWSCPKCKLKRQLTDISDFSTYPLSGTYNKYNTLAAVLFAKNEGITENEIKSALNKFEPAFGRGEKIKHNGKNLQIFLSKNPTSLNESLEAVKEFGGKDLLIILNDKIPDGLDVSWIWDINFEDILSNDMNIAVSGIRAFDMAMRLKYCGVFTHVEPDIKKALDSMTENLEENETLYVLPNYSAMLEARKILTGKEIL